MASSSGTRSETVELWLAHWLEVREAANSVAESGVLRIRDRGDLEMALMVADKLAMLLREGVESDA